MDERAATLMATQLRAIESAQGLTGKNLPHSAALTAMLGHGSLYSLADTGMMMARLDAMKFQEPAVDVPFMMGMAQSAMGFFFSHLINNDLRIPQNLISYLTLPGVGVTFSAFGTGNSSHRRLPAAFTFIGQFIDHDLTMNAMNLFDVQTGTIPDKASPYIDLDSVYGPRDPGSPLYDGEKFDLVPIGDGFDYVRDPMTLKAMIPDNRNDENEILAQIQILLMRLHNTFIDAGKTFGDAKTEVLFNWQSVVLNDYLPNIVDNAVLADIVGKLHASNYATLKHHPLIDPTLPASAAKIVTMPHEFAIGFRFGHSQLRDRYHLNQHHTVRLFNNPVPHPNDLQGGKVLPLGHVIDWTFFLDAGDAANPHHAPISNQIDTHVTNVVFDLPESTIPDDIKFIGNLAQRNLIRSSQIGLASGEDLAELYYPGNTGIRLSHAEIEPDQDKRPLFRDARDTAHRPTFRTPLWFYMLKEAELAGTGRGSFPPLPPGG